ncbi:hypothetical protein BDZ89DRAFT_104674 [Hymenopellis radicata]|nr:hypothetical protein BDZ89DRAFT_104674 [Hymenopellis radicata]
MNRVLITLPLLLNRSPISPSGCAPRSTLAYVILCVLPNGLMAATRTSNTPKRVRELLINQASRTMNCSISDCFYATVSCFHQRDSLVVRDSCVGIFLAGHDDLRDACYEDDQFHCFKAHLS